MTFNMFKPDNVSFSTLTDGYIQYGNPTNKIVISGSVANGATANFSTTIPYTRTGTRADIYVTNLNTNTKILVKDGTRFSATQNVYQFVSTEVANKILTYTSTSITVTVSIVNNSGAGINLINQTLIVNAVLYDAPFA